MLRTVYNEIKIRGLVPTLQHIMQKMIGVWGMREELETLHYFLNEYHQASNALPARDPDLRLLQRCDIQLLRIFSKECNKLGISYWLDFGTLLGAVRHKGFIPWDDDLDISMLRSDYNRVLLELKNTLSSYGIEMEETNRIGIGYRHKETGIWLDVFARDDYYCDNLDDFNINELKNKIDKTRKCFNRKKKKATIESKDYYRKKIIGGLEGNYRFVYLQPEFKYIKNIIHPYEIVFPLGEVILDGYNFSSPNNSDMYLKEIYGNGYMGFPRKGILHHDEGRGPLSTWAKKNNVDMQLVLKELTSIADGI